MPKRTYSAYSVPKFVIRLSSTIVFVCLMLSCQHEDLSKGEATTTKVRVATFNIWELSRKKLDQLGQGGNYNHPQLLNAAEIIQRVRPDILLLNEIDFDADRAENARLFVERFLAAPQNGQEAINYPHIFFAATNTGEPTGIDLDRDGRSDGPGDCFGFGRYPGQYGMALLSRFPIDRQAVRTFRKFLWRQLPDRQIPDGEFGRPEYYDADAVALMRLSSKSHWDLPIRIQTPKGIRTVHILGCHPTPPVFDGDEDRNGRRNFDEIRLWADYLRGGDAASYLLDDAGRNGGLDQDSSFVLMGDMNADPFGASEYGQPAIDQLLKHPRVFDPKPRGAGGDSFKKSYAGDPQTRTAAYGRLDYVLPSRDLSVSGSAVFWPAPKDPLGHLMHGKSRASDHALVWLDLRF